MKICIIAEGSYPYVTGGVSSWIQMLISNLPEHEFIIYSIGAEHKNKGNFVYSLPINLLEVKEVFLDTFLEDKGKRGRKLNINTVEKQIVKKLLIGSQFDWDELLNLLLKLDSMTDLILSKDFYDILAEGYCEKYSQTSFVDYFWAVRAMVLPLFNIIKTTLPEADIYHSVSTGYAGIVAALGKFLNKKPFLLTEHGIYTREREEEIIKSNWVKGYFKDMWIEFFYSLSRCAYTKADKVISLFDNNRKIQIELGCPSEKIDIIANGVRLEDFSTTKGNELGGEKINIGAVVRVVPIKDIKTMIHSFALVKELVGNACFYIMGPTDEDIEYYKECVKLVELLRVEDVIFTGKVNIKDYMGRMDILVLTSISEGQPLAILEGMACKKPFVTTDVGSCKELLLGKDDLYGDGGITAPVMNYVKISEGIIKLCMDRELSKNMGLNAYNRVSNLYTIEKFIGSYRKLYSDLGGL